MLTFARQKRAGLITTSARVFQAFRIAVNEEDGLRDVLEKVAPWLLILSRSGGMMKARDVDEGNGGMLVVLSYHYHYHSWKTRRVLLEMVALTSWEAIEEKEGH
jgi:16S rRNA C1402 N4-methylase RsmH